MLRRIDYYQPVIRSEYIELLKRYPNIFRAKEFYYKDSWLGWTSDIPKSIELANRNSILLGIQPLIRITTLMFGLTLNQRFLQNKNNNSFELWR